MNQMKHKYLGGMAAMLFLAGLSGCGPELHPVEGQLVWEGGEAAEELDGSMLYFVSSEHHTTSRSIVRDGGRFELTTNKPEAQGADGVPPGQHEVYIIGREGSSVLDNRFRNPATSGLTVKVPPDEPVVLQLARAKTKPGTRAGASSNRPQLSDRERE